MLVIDKNYQLNINCHHKNIVHSLNCAITRNVRSLKRTFFMFPVTDHWLWILLIYDPLLWFNNHAKHENERSYRKLQLVEKEEETLAEYLRYLKILPSRIVNNLTWHAWMILEPRQKANCFPIFHINRSGVWWIFNKPATTKQEFRNFFAEKF